MKVFKIAILFIFIGTSVFATENFEVISDIDLGFFGSNPKLPWGGDPFLREPGYASVPVVVEKHNLSAIIYSKGSPIAIVDGKSVREGTMVGDRRVSVIGDNYVLLKKQGSEIELTLPPILDGDSDEIDEEEAK